ncbi:MAG: hypothetical protein V2I33_16955 [Kangiellaceae bacterium]|jgi:hypothetical protein|nr:hypothetical protein [Kangiellaceae bacterium]
MRQRDPDRPTKSYTGTEKLLLTCHVCGPRKDFEILLASGITGTQGSLHFEFSSGSHSRTRHSSARNEFEKDYNKLLNNSLFGKTMENVRKCVDYRLVNTRGEVAEDGSQAKFCQSGDF